LQPLVLHTVWVAGCRCHGSAIAAATGNQKSDLRKKFKNQIFAKINQY